LSSEDPDIEIIKARKLREMKEKAATLERIKEIEKKREEQKAADKDDGKSLFARYLYDRADEVLAAAEAQYPSQTRAIVMRVAELIKSGEINQRISGGELLSLFRSVGLNVRINTTIKIEDHGKLVSFSDKLKQESADT
jgi:DNA-binding TFAR19-related protein (PDSD5 family)